MSATSETETSPIEEALKILRMTVAEEQSKAIWAEVVKLLNGQLSIAAIAPGVLPALDQFERKIERAAWLRVSQAYFEAGISTVPAPVETWDEFTRLVKTVVETHNINLKLQCDDCDFRHRETRDLIVKGDHHGGTKRVCADRDACHRRKP